MRTLLKVKITNLETRPLSCFLICSASLRFVSFDEVGEDNFHQRRGAVALDLQTDPSERYRSV